MVFIFLSLSILFAYSDTVISEVYHVTPSQCPAAETSCLTLSLLARNTSSYLDSDTTLILLQGNHILKSELLVKNTSRISITMASSSLSSSVTIKCEYHGRLSFDSVDYVNISNLEFIECRGHQVRFVNRLILNNCAFLNHVETAVTFINSSANVTKNSFISNSVDSPPGSEQIGAAIVVTMSDITIEESTFEENSGGGAMFVELHSNITIVNSTFVGNLVTNSSSLDCFGGVVYAVNNSNLEVNNSVFQSNLAHCQNAKGGVFAVIKGTLIIQHCLFEHNEATEGEGGVIFTQTSNTTINVCTFRNNTASIGGVLHLDVRSLVETYEVTLKHNTAEQGIMYLVESTAIFEGGTEVSDNVGSLLMYYSNATFRDTTIFVSNKPTSTLTTHFQEGGAITMIRSSITFEGTSNLEYNQGENGGAVQSIASKLYVYGSIVISNNTATDSGGGIYLFLSELKSNSKSTLDLLGNAAEKGGGIHAISSIVTAVYGSEIKVMENVATMDGGGIYLEVDAKLNVLVIHEHSARLSEEPQHSAFTFIGNSADYGGAVYVADDTNSGTCNNSEAYSAASECFLQTIILGSGIESDIMSSDSSSVNVKFMNNHAQTRGLNVFGGLLDRCTLSPFTNRYRRSSQFVDALTYFTSLSNINTSDLTSISSRPVRVCFCNGSQLQDCSYKPPSLSVKKGETFTISLAAVDQVNHTISTKVYSILSSTEGRIVGGEELIQNASIKCTNLNFSVISPHDYEELTLYADGPCKDANKSRSVIRIHFSPCMCPVGFQQNVAEQTTCVCECDSKLTKYVHVTNCSQLTKTLVRGTNSWISYINTTGNSSGYLIHRHCPLDYCKPSVSIPINLSTPNGADVQCALHRSGALCGTCQSDFSVSLGSSSCIACPSYWPAVFIAIIAFFFLAGVALRVALVLVLNLTVAIGTLNGIIFYANIVAANSGIFFTFLRPNFVTVFISWLNLDFGFNACFIKTLDAYWKTWLQLTFPVYVIFLVVMIIIISRRSKKFSQLIGKKNPVATLATLIFLSYAKLLRTVIAALSCTTLLYSGLSGEHYNTPLVWLPDATVGCLRGRHIILFIAAIIILLAGIAYTVLLFSWQWLLYLHNKFFGTWVRNLKLSIFVETYHAPYTPQNRYWTGLLLLIRVILYIASAANVSGDPRIDLLVIGTAVVSILLLKEIIGVSCQVYKNLPIEVLEVYCYLNLILFCFATLYVLESENARAAVAYTSVSITFVLFLGVLFYHIFTEVITKTKIWMKIKTHNSNRRSMTMEDSDITETLILTSSRIEEAEQQTSSITQTGSNELLYINRESDSTY